MGDFLRAGRGLLPGTGPGAGATSGERRKLRGEVVDWSGGSPTSWGGA